MFDIPDKSVSRVVAEHFDITDRETRKVFVSVDESEGNKVLASLASKLYDAIIQKVDDIDFGTIPVSKGDITKIGNYDKIVDCLAVMDEMLKESNQESDSVEVIQEAVKNIKDRKDIFEKGFRYGAEVVMLTYCTITLAVISSTSLMISSCIEFIKSPNQDDIKMSISNVSNVRTKESLLFSNLKRFNRLCANKKIDATFEYSLKNSSKQLVGIDTGLVLSTVAITTLVLSIIPMLRELIYFFFNTRTRISDYFEVQANLLQMNAYNVQSSEAMKKSERDKIAKKQLKIVSLFRKLSNFLSIENKKAESKTKQDVSKEDKKVKISDITDELPDSVASSSLF